MLCIVCSRWLCDPDLGSLAESRLSSLSSLSSTNGLMLGAALSNLSRYMPPLLRLQGFGHPHFALHS